jgi:hypothetical protein
MTNTSAPDPAVERRPLPVSWIYLVVLLVAFAIFGVGIYVLVTYHVWSMLAAGCASLVAVGVAWPLSVAISCSRVQQSEAGDLLQPLTERLDQISILLNVMSEQQLLSDRAKSVAFRDKDREAILRAIQEESARHEWDAAYALADQFEQAFGSKAEADRFRQEINDKRNEGVRKQVAEVVAVIDRHTRAEQWNAAVREAEKLIVRFPGNTQVKNLPHEIEARRQAHKRQLLSSWHDAVARHDVDGSIEILKQLDTYLTPAEAEAMQDTARNVFKEKLNTLGAAFSSAVRGNRWQEAVRVGEEIQRDFPNSRISQEVHEKMEALRQRASEEPVTAPV